LTVPTSLVSISNVRVVVLANFVVVPAIAFGAEYLISSDEQGLRTGLLIVVAAAGAPFLPKLVQTARGSLPLGWGSWSC